jgi:predicted nuclease of predicted toxin-antitoxin system
VDRRLAFKVNETLPEHVARILRDGGYDAVTNGAQRLSGTPDARLSEAIVSGGGALVTFDLDFGDIRAYQAERCPGIIVLRVSRANPV